MKVVVPWPVDAPELTPMPEGVELVAWIDGDPPEEALDAEFVAVPYSAGKPGLLDGFTRMKVLQTESAGVGWILPHVPAGVTVCDASGPHDQSTAEWVLAAILSSVRQIPWYVRQQALASWSPRDGHELGGRRVLLVGAGSIGRAVERMLSGFGVDITRVARTARDGVHSFEELPVALADRRRGGPARTPDRPHLRHGRRRVSRRPARWCPRRQRVSRCRRRPGRVARRADDRPHHGGARRHLARAVARRPPAVARARGAHHAPRRRRHVRGPPAAADLRTGAGRPLVAGEPLLNVVENGY